VKGEKRKKAVRAQREVYLTGVLPQNRLDKKMPLLVTASEGAVCYL